MSQTLKISAPYQNLLFDVNAYEMQFKSIKKLDQLVTGYDGIGQIVREGFFKKRLWFVHLEENEIVLNLFCKEIFKNVKEITVTKNIFYYTVKITYANAQTAKQKILNPWIYNPSLWFSVGLDSIDLEMTNFVWYLEINFENLKLVLSNQKNVTLNEQA